MKKIFSILVLCLSFISITVLFGCSNNKSVPKDTPPETINSSNKTFTLEELKKYNGQNGNPAYIAVDGTVYDVTNVKQWKNGNHQGYIAGEDLSDAINSSPHGKDVLINIPIVGKMAS